MHIPTVIVFKSNLKNSVKSLVDRIELSTWHNFWQHWNINVIFFSFQGLQMLLRDTLPKPIPHKFIPPYSQYQFSGSTVASESIKLWTCLLGSLSRAIFSSRGPSIHSRGMLLTVAAVTMVVLAVGSGTTGACRLRLCQSGRYEINLNNTPHGKHTASPLQRKIR